MGSIRFRGLGVAWISLACVLVPAAALAASADYFLKIEGIDGESKDAKHKGEIEIQSFSWGVSQSQHQGGGTGMGAGKVNMQDMSVMRGPRQTTSMDGAHVAAGDVDGDGRADAAAAGRYGVGMPSVKRTHPALIKITKPLETGSMTMAMKLPACAVGTRYPAAELTTPDGRYMLQDLVVASCGAGASASGGSAPTEQVTLNYSKVQVRGWDPKKKED